MLAGCHTSAYVFHWYNNKGVLKLKQTMQKQLLCPVMAALLFTGCIENEVIVDNPTLSVSPPKVYQGDTVTITLEPGERTNVDLDVTFYWEDEEIGRADAEPYRIEHVVIDSVPGLYSISCNAVGKQEGATYSNMASVRREVFLQVVRD